MTLRPRRHACCFYTDGVTDARGPRAASRSSGSSSCSAASPARGADAIAGDDRRRAARVPGGRRSATTSRCSPSRSPSAGRGRLLGGLVGIGREDVHGLRRRELLGERPHRRVAAELDDDRRRRLAGGELGDELRPVAVAHVADRVAFVGGVAILGADEDDRDAALRGEAAGERPHLFRRQREAAVRTPPPARRRPRSSERSPRSKPAPTTAIVTRTPTVASAASSVCFQPHVASRPSASAASAHRRTATSSARSPSSAALPSHSSSCSSAPGIWGSSTARATSPGITSNAATSRFLMPARAPPPRGSSSPACGPSRPCRPCPWRT